MTAFILLKVLIFACVLVVVMAFAVTPSVADNRMLQ